MIHQQDDVFLRWNSRREDRNEVFFILFYILHNVYLCFIIIYYTIHAL